MPSTLRDFTTTTADWRRSLRQNRRRTFYVIITFLLIYLALGGLIDLYLYSGSFPQASLSHIGMALITFQLWPKATIVVVVVAVIALWVTYAFADRLMLLGIEYRKITPDTAQNAREQQLYNVVEEMKVAAGLHFMPTVYVMDADYMNAFASGYSEKSAMVAITRGLMEKLDRDELAAVMAHELSHIRHMDIRLTLTASVLANITLIVIDILFFSTLFGGRNGREGRGRNQLFIIILLLRYLLPLVTVILMLYLSRTREYMADAGSVELMRTNEPLARALLKIQGDHEQHQAEYGAAYAATPHESLRREAYIFDPCQMQLANRQSMASDFFSTHPSLAKRLKAIGVTKKSV
ncbi:MAG: zinc metalloprotease HtpX [Coxiella sp. RIFCSPHIGHO2_12_FULL_44_14]|nr:MAG: zinc metalloprotease HtpX [Coxiella sp. RIFCSPHIGHO2_12_FULL_44_14]